MLIIFLHEKTHLGSQPIGRFFLFYQLDKEFENIQKLILNNFNFHIEIKHVRKSQTIDWHD